PARTPRRRVGRCRASRSKARSSLDETQGTGPRSWEWTRASAPARVLATLVVTTNAERHGSTSTNIDLELRPSHKQRFDWLSALRNPLGVRRLPCQVARSIRIGLGRLLRPDLLSVCTVLHQARPIVGIDRRDHAGGASEGLSVDNVLPKRTQDPSDE